MSDHYVLIDYENVQPKNLEILARHPFKVIVFVGANLAKIPLDLAVAMQALGPNAQYLKMAGNGPNALDFHIAFYLGELSTLHPKADFNVVSKDTGFDPLIKHLRARQIRAHRIRDLAEIPMLRLSTASSDDEKIDAIVKNLAGRGQSRPRRVKTLANTINSLLADKLDDEQLLSLVHGLEKSGHIVINNNNVSYRIKE
jgi:hypothetical protein